jgi:hypothetical protein
MGTATSARRTMTQVTGPISSPGLALLSRSRVGLLWGNGGPRACPKLHWSTSVGVNRWSAPKDIGACGRFPMLSQLSGVWRAAWVDSDHRVVFAQRSSSGAWTTHRLVHKETGVRQIEPQVRLVAAKTGVVVAWTTKIKSGEQRAIVAIRRGDRWRESVLDDGTMAGQAHDVHVGAVGLVGAVAQVLLTHNRSFDLVRRQSSVVG